MPRIKEEITWGDIMTTLAFLAAGLGAYFGLKADVAAEAAAREISDTELASQVGSNARAISSNMDRLKEFERWRQDHQREFDRTIRSE